MQAHCHSDVPFYKTWHDIVVTGNMLIYQFLEVIVFQMPVPNHKIKLYIFINKQSEVSECHLKRDFHLPRYVSSIIIIIVIIVALMSFEKVFPDKRSRL